MKQNYFTKQLFLFIFTLFVGLSGTLLAQTVFINEIHYDNDGADTGEAIEIAGPAGTDLTDWTVVLYNGSNGTAYGTITLSGVISNISNGYGMVTANYAGIQNGAPDGMALVNNLGNVVQFLSYEGSFTASSGAADGLTSTNIGVSEAGTTPVGHSLQLAGSGTVYSDFSWQSAAANTFGAVNNGQVFGNSLVDTEAPSAPTNLAAGTITQTTVDLSWTASTDNVGVTTYQIFEGVNQVGTTSEITFTVTGLTANTLYSFTVKAKDAADNLSGASNSVAATTLENAVATEANLIITGVFDGPLTGGVPKVIELYVVNDIADLSAYGFGSANNGGGTDGQEFTFSGAANRGDFIYVATEINGFSSFFDFEPDFTSGAAAINGDDAIELFFNGNVIDVFGDINVDGTGQPWDYVDGWAYRKDNTGPDGSTFVLDNWIFSGADAIDNETTNATAATPFPIGTYGPDILITGVIDGPLSGGTPKAIEFYIATDIADLSVYGFGSANNGGGTDGQEFTFSGSASKGDYIYVASESTYFNNFFGFAPTFTSGAASINGDDAIELFYNGEVIDVFGEIDVDGTGKPWDYMDGWAYRKSNTGPDGSTFVLENWTFSGINAIDNETTNATAATPFPIGTYGGATEEPLELITILEARATPDGENVKITGVLTVSDQFGGSAYIQDETGGIAVFDESVHGSGLFQIGDVLIITGKRSSFNEQIQISPVTAVELDSESTLTIAPKTISLSEMVDYPGQLVRILNPQFPKPGDMLFGNSNYLLTDESGTGELRIDIDAADLVGLAQPENCQEVIGVVGRFFEIYQLLPRIKSDLECAEKYAAEGNDLAISKDRTFDLVTWNLEWFGDEANSPAAGNANSDEIQKNSVKNVLQELNADIYAVQEISDDALFAQMVSELPGYNYVLSEATSYPFDTQGTKQKIGFIYNTNTVSNVETKVLLESIHPYYNGGDDSALADYPETDKTRFYASGRLPFMLTANVTIDGNSQQVNVVNLHARANSGTDALGRYYMRKYDVEVLKDSLDVYYPNANVIILGDYNDDVDFTVADVSTTETTYSSYVADIENYFMSTKVLSDAGFRSYVFNNDVIDHISVTNELASNYIDESARVHYEFYSSDYAKTTSDHFPVSLRLQLSLLAFDSVEVNNVSCNGQEDGSITVQVSGGVMPYSYTWSNGAANVNSISGLSGGTYSVTVTDALNNEITQEFTVTEALALQVDIDGNDAVYLGYSEALCTTLTAVNISGGVAPYSYRWNTGDTTNSITVCPTEETTYTVTVTDAKGCTITVRKTVKVVDVSCGTSPTNPKVSVCSNRRTLCVSEQSVKWILIAGAKLGACVVEKQYSHIYVTNVNVFPNPFRDVVNVSFYTNSAEPVEFHIYDFRGQLIDQYSFEVVDKRMAVSLDLGHLARGRYFLKAVIDGGVKSVKSIVKY